MAEDCFLELCADVVEVAVDADARDLRRDVLRVLRLQPEDVGLVLLHDLHQLLHATRCAEFAYLPRLYDGVRLGVEALHCRCYFRPPIWIDFRP